MARVDSYSSRRDLPRISVVTPSYNQADYLEATIRSVLDQDYPNLEYIVVDGGSDDGSIDIIKKYAHKLAWWVSEPDQGQSHAINKGFERANGQILAYLNSDDLYLPGTLMAVANAVATDPKADLFYGTCRVIDETGQTTGTHTGNISEYSEILDLWRTWWGKRQFVQPEVFWTRRVMQQVGEFREDLNYVMDYEFWLRVLRAGGKTHRIDRELACFRRTALQKSNASEAVADELLAVLGRELQGPSVPRGTRRRLHRQWLYHTAFCQAANDSVAQRESTCSRWIRLAAVCAAHPTLLLDTQIYRRPAGRLARAK